mgnify:CR=1 FL=1
MKITRAQLKQIIKEELSKVLETPGPMYQETLPPETKPKRLRPVRWRSGPDRPYSPEELRLGAMEASRGETRPRAGFNPQARVPRATGGYSEYVGGDPRVSDPHGGFSADEDPNFLARQKMEAHRDRMWDEYASAPTGIGPMGRWGPGEEHRDWRDAWDSP